MLKNFVKHFKTITRHKWEVLKLCIKAGIPYRGIAHDMSKYSPTEFFESIKYYQGSRSPISACIEENGYSKAWLHHKGRNKHHFQYWYDYSAKTPTPIIPYKYTVEMICDNIAAGIVYQGKNWKPDISIIFWNRLMEDAKINEKTKAMITETFEQVAKEGIDKTINKENLKRLYAKHCM